MPSEIVETVRESSIDAILDKFKYCQFGSYPDLDDVVVDPNGEVVSWLAGDTAEPYLYMKKFLLLQNGETTDELDLNETMFQNPIT